MAPKRAWTMTSGCRESADIGSLHQRPCNECQVILFRPGLKAHTLWYGQYVSANCWARSQARRQCCTQSVVRILEDTHHEHVKASRTWRKEIRKCLIHIAPWQRVHLATFHHQTAECAMSHTDTIHRGLRTWRVCWRCLRPIEGAWRRAPKEDTQLVRCGDPNVDEG